MKILCLYSVESFVTVERPLEVATEIPFGISMIITLLKRQGHDVDLIVITPKTPLEEVLGTYVRKHKPKMAGLSAVATQFRIMCRAAEVL
jgi:hypothetical protein